VCFHQESDFEGRECREPFAIIVTTDDDPDHIERNRAALEQAMRQS